jgi:hypothetical protein
MYFDLDLGPTFPDVFLVFLGPSKQLSKNTHNNCDVTKKRNLSCTWVYACYESSWVSCRWRRTAIVVTSFFWVKKNSASIYRHKAVPFVFSLWPLLSNLSFGIILQVLSSVSIVVVSCYGLDAAGESGFVRDRYLYRSDSEANALPRIETLSETVKQLGCETSHCNVASNLRLRPNGERGHSYCQLGVWRRKRVSAEAATAAVSGCLPTSFGHYLKIC